MDTDEHGCGGRRNSTRRKERRRSFNRRWTRMNADGMGEEFNTENTEEREEEFVTTNDHNESRIGEELVLTTDGHG
jgi:hypothetical protein